MKNWAVSDIRWASVSDLKLPFWVQWNKNNPLPDHSWPKIWEYPYIASRIPANGKSPSVDSGNLNEFEDDSFDYTFSVSTVDEMPDLFSGLGEIIRLARHRASVTINVSDSAGLSRFKLRELEEFLGIRIPPLPPDPLDSISPVLQEFGQKPNEACRHIRVLGFTLDSRDSPRSAAILIPHWESWQFLKPCLESIQRYRHQDLAEKVYVLDDASKDGSFENARENFKNDPNIEFHQFARPNHDEPDIGLLLDYGLQLVNEQYVAMIDADLFPISRDWLAFPIMLIEAYNCSSVGLDTGISTAYLTKTPAKNWWQTYQGDWKGYWTQGGLFDNEVFTCTNNLYRVMPTALAKVVSENIGFTRATGYPVKHPERPPYIPGGWDSGVAANHFIDINRLGPKFNIPLTSYIGLTPGDGAFGQNISGLAFHFALSTRALSRERREVNNAGDDYLYWLTKFQKSQEFEGQCISDQNLREMIEASSQFHRSPGSWWEREYLYIQKLLDIYMRQMP